MTTRTRTETRTRTRTRTGIALLVVFLGGVARATGIPDAAELKKLSARLAPVDLTADVGRLSARERAALARILKAAKIMDALFLRQVWAGNETLLLDLVRDGTPLGRERLHAFLQNKGPWLRLDEERPFIPGVGEKPPAANFYPPGATKDEIERWMNRLPADARATAAGF